MTLAEYVEIPRGAGYPPLPREPQSGDIVARCRFYLQGRKYGRQVLITGDDGDGFVYEVAAECTQVDANRAGTIVEYKLTQYGEPLVPGGLPSQSVLTDWEAVVPQKPWPYETDFDRHTRQALQMLDNSREQQLLTDEQHAELTAAMASGQYRAIEFDEHGVPTVWEPIDESVPFMLADPSAAPRRRTEEEANRLRDDLLAGRERAIAQGRYGVLDEEGAALVDESIPFVLAEPSATPFDVPLPDPFAEPPMLDTRGYLGLGESIGVDAPGGERFVITVVPADAELAVTRGADQHAVSLPIGQTYTVEDVDGAKVHVVAVENPADAAREARREQGIDY